MKVPTFKIAALLILLLHGSGCHTRVKTGKKNAGIRNEVVVVPQSSYVFVGEQYKAKIFLRTYDPKIVPESIVFGQMLPLEDDKNIYTAIAKNEGDKVWSGTLRIKQPDSTVKEYPIPEQSYTVAKPTASVFPDKMNVFYIGVDNPISVHAPGYGRDKTHVTISKGTVTGSNGLYNVWVTQRGTVRVTVSGENIPGKKSVLSVTEFRVKEIPQPRVKFANKSGGKLSVAEMKSQDKLFAIIENFDFSAGFTVNHFTMWVMMPRRNMIRYESATDSFTPEMHAVINRIVPRSKVIFDSVAVTGPDGIKSYLDPILFNIE